VMDAPSAHALPWLRANRPAFAPRVGLELPAEHEVDTGEAVCTLDRVSFAYDGGPPVLEDAGLRLRRGEVVALTGPNGAGKTTLARLAAGLLKPDSGTRQLLGRAGYLPQDSGRYLVCERVDHEIALGGHVSDRALEELGLAGFEARHPRDLSSGERERVALAAVLAPEPDLLVLDEPTRGMDPERKEELAALIRLQAERRATLVVTHELVFAGDVADREVALRMGEAAVVA
jgi:energy-coupling factor transporter ATP-binding protein EcfA2